MHCRPQTAGGMTSLTTRKPQGFLLHVLFALPTLLLSPHCIISFGLFCHLLSQQNLSLYLYCSPPTVCPLSPAHIHPLTLRRPVILHPSSPPHPTRLALFPLFFPALSPSSYFILSNPFHGASCVNNRDRPSMFSQSE